MNIEKPEENIPEEIEASGPLTPEKENNSLEELLDFFADLTDEPRRLRARLKIKIDKREVSISDLARCKINMNMQGDLSKKRPYMEVVNYIVSWEKRVRENDRAADMRYNDRLRAEKERARNPRDPYNGGFRD